LRLQLQMKIGIRGTYRIALVGAGLFALVVGSGSRHLAQAQATGVENGPGGEATDLPGALDIPVAGIAKGDLRDTFSDSRGSHVHHAIDILAPRGTPAVAAVDGTILKLFISRAGGTTIYLGDGKGWVYYYAHLDRYADDLRENMAVRKGDVIGFVGTTGNAPANTPHLHFEIERLPPGGDWWKGSPVNPYPILMAEGRTVRA
jgi:murein DD-endopeptidase MepM/ murein hydrolase activator NlpD